MEKKLIHSKEIIVRWGDMDAYGHVNNIIYFQYIQEARFSMMAEKNIPIDPNGISPVLADTSCKFIRPITYPETILVNTYFTEVRGKKVIFENEIVSVKNPAVVYAITSSTVVWFDFSTGKSCEVPDYVHEWSNLDNKK